MCWVKGSLNCYRAGELPRYFKMNIQKSLNSYTLFLPLERVIRVFSAQRSEMKWENRFCDFCLTVGKCAALEQSKKDWTKMAITAYYLNESYILSWLRKKLSIAMSHSMSGFWTSFLKLYTTLFATPLISMTLNTTV